MSTTLPRPLLEIRYYEAAQAYLASLPPEHHMEATPQATQREISVESFALLRLERPEVQYFNELLVQYPYGDRDETRQVVPDNMIVLHDEPIKVVSSYDVELQPTRPFLVLEYVSKSSKRKDYEDSFHKYERELKVPYYLLFYPDTQDLTLFRRGKQRYLSVKPNDAGRLAIPELDLEVALNDGWARYWYQGEILELPAKLKQSLDESRKETREAREQARQADEKARQADEKARQADEKARQADEKARQADEKARQADEKIEQLRAQLRSLGIEPTL